MATDSKRGGRARVSVAALQILLALGLLAATQGPAFGQQSVGAVADLEGTARLSRGTQEFEVALKMAVIARDRIQTMSKSHLTVTLDGGSQLMLEKSSTMVIDGVVASALSNSSISLKLGHLRAVVYPTLSAIGLSPSQYPSDRLVSAGKEGRHETSAVQ